jgi:hypothetical protein
MSKVFLRRWAEDYASQGHDTAVTILALLDENEAQAKRIDSLENALRDLCDYWDGAKDGGRSIGLRVQDASSVLMGALRLSSDEALKKWKMADE